MNNDHKKSPLIDRLIYFGGIIGPIMTVPQVYQIWAGKNAAGVSVLSWSAYSVGAIFWIWYGIQHKQMPIILAQALYLILELFIVAGALLYGTGA